MGASLPLSRHNTFASTDLDSVREYVSGLFSRHRLSLTDKAAQINTRLHHMQMTDLSFVYLDYGAPVLIQPGCLENFYLLQMILKGCACVSYGKKQYLARAGQATLINPNEPVKITSSPECRFLSIRLNKKLIKRQLTETFHHPPPVPLDFLPDMDFKSSGGQAIHRYIRFLTDEIDLLWEQPCRATYQRLEQTLASMLIELHPHNYTEQLIRRDPGPVKPYVKKATQYMRENLGQTISLEDLAQAAQTTPRTLRNAFQSHYGMSPMCYLKSIRLDQARQMLSAAPPDTHITGIAMDCGISHLGRFSRDYKNRFGEMPSQTLKK